MYHWNYETPQKNLQVWLIPAGGLMIPQWCSSGTCIIGHGQVDPSIPTSRLLVTVVVSINRSETRNLRYFLTMNSTRNPLHKKKNRLALLGYETKGAYKHFGTKPTTLYESLLLGRPAGVGGFNKKRKFNKMPQVCTNTDY